MTPVNNRLKSYELLCQALNLLINLCLEHKRLSVSGLPAFLSHCSHRQHRNRPMMAGSAQCWASTTTIAMTLVLTLVCAIVACIGTRSQIEWFPIVHDKARKPHDDGPSVRRLISNPSAIFTPGGAAAINEGTKETTTPSQAPRLSPTLQPLDGTSQPTPKAGDSSGAQDVTSSKRPHIVMVVIDDMGYADLGFKGSGIRTPTIDRLVAAGTRLTNYYVLPACTHTRVAFLSGMYPYRAGIYKVLQVRSQNGMNTKDATLANVLAARGYKAHAVGKWHLGHAWSDYLPTFRGFQSFLGCWLNHDHFKHTALYNADNVDAYDLHWDTREKCGPGCTGTLDYRGKYSTTIFTNRAVNVIRSTDPSSGKPPLFLYLAYQAVHTPLQVPAQYLAQYESMPGWSNNRKIYAGMLTAVDDGIAAIVQALKEQGLWDNTLMIITTDNGAPGGQGGSNTPLRGGKMQTYEGAIRADGMIVGPARKKLGILPGTNPRLFHALDWMPTLTDLSDSVDKTSTNDADWSKMDGISQVRSLRGGKGNRREAFLGYDYHDNTNTGLAFRSGDMKLLRRQDGKYELYNLTNDIIESKNLWTAANVAVYQKRVTHLKRRIQWYETQFNTHAPSLGQCPRQFSYGTTPWNKPLMIPWCNAEVD